MARALRRLVRSSLEIDKFSYIFVLKVYIPKQNLSHI